MKRLKRILAVIVILAISITMMPVANVNAATKSKLNKKKATICVGKTIQLKVENNKKKVKWFTSNKKIATVSAKGKVKGKKAGKVTITAKVGKKKYKCKVTVKNVYEKINKAIDKSVYVDKIKASDSKAVIKISTDEKAKEFHALVEISDNNGEYFSRNLLNINSKGKVTVAVSIYFSDIKVIGMGTSFKAQRYTSEYLFEYDSVSIHELMNKKDSYKLADMAIHTSISCIAATLSEIGFDMSDIYFENY